MASKKSYGNDRPGGGQPKRPTATIDLEAKEIEDGAPRDEENAAGPSLGIDADADTRSEAPMAGDASQARSDSDSAASAEHSGSAERSEPSEDASAASAIRSESPEAAARFGDETVEQRSEETSVAAAERTPQERPDDAAAASGSGSSMPPIAPAPVTHAASGSRIGRFVGYVGAAVLGGLIALFGADYAGRLLGFVVPGTQSAIVQQLAQRIDRLDAEVRERGTEALDVQVRERLQAFATRLEELTAMRAALADLGSAQKSIAEQLAALQQQVSQMSAGTLDPVLGKRIADMEATLKALSETAAAGDGRIPQLAQLTGRINDFEAELDQRLTALNKSLTEQLAKTTGELEARISESGSSIAIETLKAGTTRLGREVETVKLSTEQLDQRLQILQAAGEDLRKALASLEVAQGQLDTTIASVKSGFEARLEAMVTPEALARALQPIDVAIGRVRDDLAIITEREKSREASANRILLSLELANLKRAIDRGAPFAEELARVRQMAPAELDFAPLEPVASTGLATAASLNETFRDTARAILDADQAPTDGNGGIIDNLLSSARSVIRVRRTGEVEGDSSEAVVARMEVALKAGNLARVLAEAEKLEGSPREAAAAWLSQIKARLAVEQAIAAIEDGLKKSLADIKAN